MVLILVELAVLKVIGGAIRQHSAVAGNIQSPYCHLGVGARLFPLWEPQKSEYDHP